MIATETFSPTIQSLRRLGLSARNLDVQEIGSYTLVGDGKNLVRRDDRSGLRELIENVPPGSPREMDFDLNQSVLEGDAAAGEHYVEAAHFIHIFDWLREHASDLSAQRESTSVHIITQRSLLAALAKILYNQDAGGSKGWIFGAAKVNGKVILGRIVRPGVQQYLLKDQVEQNGFSTGIRKGDRQFVLSLTQEPGPNESPTYSRFRTVNRVQLADLTMLVEGNVDAVDSSSAESAPSSYVEFAGTEESCSPDGKDWYRFYQERMLRWWANAVFVGIGNVYVGVHDTSRRVKKVQAYKVNSIPETVQTVASTLPPRACLLEESVCVGFVYQLMKFVLRNVLDNHTEAVYEFQCEKIPKQSQKLFQCTRIPRKDAVGHGYFPEDIRVV